MEQGAQLQLQLKLLAAKMRLNYHSCVLLCLLNTEYYSAGPSEPCRAYCVLQSTAHVTTSNVLSPNIQLPSKIYLIIPASKQNTYFDNYKNSVTQL